MYWGLTRPIAAYLPALAKRGFGLDFNIFTHPRVTRSGFTFTINWALVLIRYCAGLIDRSID